MTDIERYSEERIYRNASGYYTGQIRFFRAIRGSRATVGEYSAALGLSSGSVREYGPNSGIARSRG